MNKMKFFLTFMFLFVVIGCSSTIKEEKTSILNEDLLNQNQNNTNVDEYLNVAFERWKEETKKNDYVITFIGSTECLKCTTFKIILEKVANQYNLTLFSYFVNQLENEEYNKIINYYDSNFNNAVPHLFITKNGVVINNWTGKMTNEELVEFLRLNLVIS